MKPALLNKAGFLLSLTLKGIRCVYRKLHRQFYDLDQKLNF